MLRTWLGQRRSPPRHRPVRGCGPAGALCGVAVIAAAAAAALRENWAARAWLSSMSGCADKATAHSAAATLSSPAHAGMSSTPPLPTGRFWRRHSIGHWREGRGPIPTREWATEGGFTRGSAQPAAALGAGAAGLAGAWFSGYGEAFSTIFLSEMGDKTFWLTVMLAMRRGKLLAWVSSQTALWSMTLLSVSIGVALRRLPVGDLPVVTVAAALLFVVFGVQSLRERKSPLPENCPDDEKNEAECEIDEQLQKSKSGTSVAVWLRFSVLIFLAEWGDRSMLATVGLAASRSPFGVLLGGCMGHCLAAVLAVLSGDFLNQYISDRLISTVSGVLFIVFGVTTLLGIY